MNDQEFQKCVRDSLKRRKLSDESISQINVEIVRDPVSIATTYKVHASEPELIKVTEYEIGKIVAKHGAPTA